MRAIASASNVARVTKLGKGRSLSPRRQSVGLGIMSFCALPTEGGEAAPYEESSGREGGQIDSRGTDATVAIIVET